MTSPARALQTPAVSARQQRRSLFERLLRRRFLLPASAIALVVFLALSVYEVTGGSGIRSRGGAPIGGDFIAFWSASEILQGGEPGATYDVERMHAVEERLMQGESPRFPWLYPPTVLLLVAGLASLPFLLALVVWLAVPLAALGWSLRGQLRDPLVLLLALGFPGVIQNASSGQTGFISAAILAAGLTMLAGSRALRGASGGASSPGTAARGAAATFAPQTFKERLLRPHPLEEGELRGDPSDSPRMGCAPATPADSVELSRSGPWDRARDDLTPRPPFLPRRGGEVAAGLVLGLLTFKPHLAPLVFLALLASRRWYALGGAIASAAALALLSFVVLGAGTWMAFLENAGATSDLLFEGNVPWHKMTTVAGGALLLGAPKLVVYALQGVVSLAAAGVVAYVWSRRDVTPVLRNVVLCLGVLLATPYAFDYDMVVLGLPLLWLSLEAQSTGWRPGEREAIAFAWLGPFAFPVVASVTGVSLMPVVIAGLMYLALRRVTQPAAGRENLAPADRPQVAA